MPWKREHKRSPLTAEQANRLINSCTDFRDKLIIYTLLDTGIRVQEFCDLKKQWIDWQNGKMAVFGKNTKGGKPKRRVVPMTARVKMILEHYFTTHEVDGIDIQVRTAENVVKRIANRAGLTVPCSPHVLRHTFGVTSLENGVPVTALQKVMGHEDLQTTMIYLNLSGEEAVRIYQDKGYK